MERILEVPENKCGNFVMDTGLNREPFGFVFVCFSEGD